MMSFVIYNAYDLPMGKSCKCIKVSKFPTCNLNIFDNHMQTTLLPRLIAPFFDHG
jgi:hypothetical protein